MNRFFLLKISLFVADFVQFVHDVVELSKTEEGLQPMLNRIVEITKNTTWK